MAEQFEPTPAPLAESPLDPPHTITDPKEFLALRGKVVKFRMTSAAMERKRERGEEETWVYGLVTLVTEHKRFQPEIRIDAQVSPQGGSSFYNILGEQLLDHPRREPYMTPVVIQTVTAEEMAGMQFSYPFWHENITPQPSAASNS